MFFHLETLIPNSCPTWHIKFLNSQSNQKRFVYLCGMTEKFQIKNPPNIIATPKTSMSELLILFKRGYSHPRVSIWSFPSFEVKGDQNYRIHQAQMVLYYGHIWCADTLQLCTVMDGRQSGEWLHVVNDYLKRVLFGYFSELNSNSTLISWINDKWILLYILYEEVRWW